MSLTRNLTASSCLLLCAVIVPVSFGQTNPMPRDYRGVQIIVPGIFVTPIPNAPFTATIEILSHELLPDGSVNTHTTTAHVARSSSGRIYNERRQLVTTNFRGDPPLLSAHIYDPSSRLNIFYNPFQRIARETILPGPPRRPPTPSPTAPRPTIPTSSRKTSARNPSTVSLSRAFASPRPSPPR